MTVRELIERLLQVADLDTPVYTATPLPTEMGDCEVTGVHDLSADDDHSVWIVWPTERGGSGMCIGDRILVTAAGLRFHG